MARSRTPRVHNDRLQLLLTCEHATNRVPKRFATLFQGCRGLLESHRGYDPGAFVLARCLQKSLRAPLLVTTVTRLLVEGNRSLHHKDLFSTMSKVLDEQARNQIIDTYHTPHWHAVIEQVGAIVQHRIAVHIGVHTFTPALNGQVRRADIGLLFDPQRRIERDFCRVWQRRLQIALPNMAIRRNYPYRGIADGLTTSLRKLFPHTSYAGIELEVNNKHLTTANSSMKKRLCAAISQTLGDTLLQAEESPSSR